VRVMSQEELLHIGMTSLAALVAREGGIITITEDELLGDHAVRMRRTKGGGITLTMVTPPDTKPS